MVGLNPGQIITISLDLYFLRLDTSLNTDKLHLFLGSVNIIRDLSNID
jgi:hypothetical protein